MSKSWVRTVVLQALDFLIVSMNNTNKLQLLPLSKFKLEPIFLIENKISRRSVKSEESKFLDSKVSTQMNVL